MTLAGLKVSAGIRHNVSWQELEQILADRDEGENGTQLAYDRGILEVIVPLPEHEYFKEVFADLIKDLADELEIDYESFGSTTWKQSAQLAVVEPDNCFYQNEPRIRPKLPAIRTAISAEGVS